MSRSTSLVTAWCSLLLFSAIGCRPIQPHYLRPNGDFVGHLLDTATQLEYPDVDEPSSDEVTQAWAPPTLSNPEFDDIWDLSLEEVVNHTLQNSEVIRDLDAVAQFNLVPQQLLRAAGLPTIYQPSIAETTVGSRTSALGQTAAASNGSVFSPDRDLVTRNSVGSVTDALGDFDAQFFSSATFQTQDRTSNVLAGGLADSFTPFQLQGANGNWTSAISKQTPGGSAFTIRKIFDYNSSNATSRALPSDWRAELEFQFQQALLRGRGASINRIPVLLARMNMDIELENFELNIRNLLYDVESKYWDLHCAYRTLENAKIGRNGALEAWKKVYATRDTADLIQEAQAREQYFAFRAQVENALVDLYNQESQLRYLMGLAASDGRVIRPIDEPTSAQVEFEWVASQNEALHRSPELRQQKWRVKQGELELKSAVHQLLPILNFTISGSVNGQGDHLGGGNTSANFAQPGSNALSELVEGNYQELLVALTFAPPAFGARREMAAIQNAKLQIQRDKALLKDMELALSHHLQTSLRETDRYYHLARTHYNRWVATVAETEAAEVLLNQGVEDSTLDRVLDAQRRRANAQIDYYRALCDYNKSIAMVHYHKGSLMEYNNVSLAEGPWPQKAYWDAMGKARQRDASRPMNYGFTRPGVVSRGPIEQPQGRTPQTPLLEEVPPGVQPLLAPQAPPANNPPATQPLNREASFPAVRGPAKPGKYPWGDLRLPNR